MRTMPMADMLPFIQESFARGQTIILPVTGGSMRPTLTQGDAVTLAAVGDRPIERGDILLYQREDGKFVLHRVVQCRGDRIDFCGDAQVVIETGISREAVIGRVVSYQKDGKEMSLRDIRRHGRRRLRSRPIRAVATRIHKAKHDTQAASVLSFLLRYLRRQIPTILVMCVLSSASAVAMLGMAFASGQVIDKALGGNLNHFREWFYILFALLVVVAISQIVYNNIRARSCGVMRNQMRRDLFESLMAKQYDAVQGMHSGDILNRLTGDLRIVVETAVSLIPQLFSIATKLIGGVAFLFFVEPMFTSVMLVAAGIFAVALQIYSRIYKRLHKECQEAEGVTRSYLQECVENMTVIKSFQGEDYALQKLDGYQQINLQKQIKRSIYSGVGSSAVYTAFTFAYYAALAWGVLRIAGVFGGAEMSVGTFAVMLQVMEQIRSPFRGATGLLPQTYSMFASAERLLELTRLPNEEQVPLKRSIHEVYEDMHTIVFDNVTFAYEDRKTVFDAMSVRFEKGKLTVVMGASGGGKSTLVKLLLGLIRPQSGLVAVEMNGERLALDAATRGLFAFVPQGNMLLSGTLLENITFGNTDVSDEEIVRAVKLACLDETVAALPQGLQTPIGERGVGLSEGQIQRVAVARALLCDAPILLLDECTSALDASTEQQLLANLHTLKDRTVIFISHRAAVLETADAVVRVEDHHVKPIY